MTSECPVFIKKRGSLFLTTLSVFVLFLSFHGHPMFWVYKKKNRRGYFIFIFRIQTLKLKHKASLFFMVKRDGKMKKKRGYLFIFCLVELNIIIDN